MLGSRIEFGELDELAARKACVEEKVHLPDLPRVAQMMVGQHGDADEAFTRLAARIRFEDGPEGLPRINLKIAGTIALECQRCLQLFEWPVRIESRLTVLRDEKQTARLCEPLDSVLMNFDGLDLRAIVEDEILAALPLAPVHDSGSDCAEQGKPENSLDIDAVQTSRPFRHLASLMGRAEKHRSH